MADSEAEIASIRSELETVQRALKHQTRRCRQLVTEYTKRLQQKEQQYQSEKALRDDQLAKVLRALIIFEARLKQEQKFISHQLKEKNYIIKKQSNEIKKLLSSPPPNRYCKSCKNQFYNNNTSPVNNLESLDSSSDYNVDYQSSNFESLDSGGSDIYATVSEKSYNQQRENSSESNNEEKMKMKSQYGRKVATYFEVLKLRNDSPCSNEDNTSNDYDNLDSLPPESVVNDKIERIDTIFKRNINENADNIVKTKITDSIPVFEDNGGSNENWYASASDQEDEEQRDVYRNNPVLECMNQILLQNINDTLNSPPITPNIERKSMKKVKFSDESNQLTRENVNTTTENANYYETPIQKVPNFYETPQSIYSNDYEQILSKSSEDNTEKTLNKDHFYVDLDKNDVENRNKSRKGKILRTPPALPPKPANLITKYKKAEMAESEPDYCSISELNLPQKCLKKIVVSAEINPINSQEVLRTQKCQKTPETPAEYDPVGANNLIVKKSIEKNVQLAKQIKTKNEPEIPKLPQVSEIIIPDENEEDKNRINHENYVQNNSQILKQKIDQNRNRSIVMGTSVSSLITGFNQQLMSEMKKPLENKAKTDKKALASFETKQNTDKPTKSLSETSTTFDLSQNFEEFKLDDCEIEEYNVNEMSDKDEEQAMTHHVELIRATSHDSAPVLNMHSIELFKRQLDKSCDELKVNNEPTYEHFLECTGLSSKSILTPSRLLSNHKSMLKPKDIKLRSKVKANSLFERHSTSTIKYWSEPYI